MIKLQTLVLSAGLTLALMGGTSTRAEEPKHLLFFGNSFTISNDVPGRVWQIAKAAGHAAPRIVSDLAGGTDLDRHILQINSNPQNNVDAPALAPGKRWDAVVFQGYSTESTYLGDRADFRGDAVTIAQLIRNHSSGKGAGTPMVLYETWARGPGHSYYPNTFLSPAAMQAEIRESYLNAQNDINTSLGAGTAFYAPVGDAYEAMNFAVSLYGGDIYHPSVLGSTLNALVLYRTIYGETTSDIEFAKLDGWMGINQTSWTQLTAVADSMAIQAIPEPVSVLLLIGGGLAMLGRPNHAK